MTMLFCDGFDWLASTSDVPKKYATGTLSGLATGRSGSGQSAYTINNNPSIVFPETFTLVIGQAWKTEGGPAASYLWRIPCPSYGSQVDVCIGNNGELIAYRRDYVFNTVLHTTAVGLIQASTWHYIEVKIFFSDTVGTVEFYVDGVSAGGSTGLDTCYITGEGAVGVFFGGRGWIDDVYVNDGSGSYNNDFLGDVTIETVRPTSDSSPLQWTATPGATHYTGIDEAAYSATDYITHDVVGERDQFGIGNLTTNPSSIHAVAVNSNATKTDTGSVSLKQYIKSSASENLSAADALAYGSVLNYQHIVERDPNGTIAWTKSAVDAAEIGVEVA